MLPYISCLKNQAGPFTAIKIKAADSTYYWEPFATTPSFKVKRNIYKNSAGSHIIFEEINTELNLTFKQEWTSSAKYGLVRIARIINDGPDSQQIQILDGCRNILPASIDNALQNGSSVLLDAYKKTDLDQKTKLSMFTLSSVLTDKAEPSENLIANVSWFTTDDEVFLDPANYEEFFENNGNIKNLTKENVLKVIY